ncbi:MAG: hypothetical protein ACI4TW_02355 [Prevotella sp.]
MTLPDIFEQNTRRLMGDDLYNRFRSVLDEDAPASIRINRKKCDAKPDDAERVAWCDDGFYLKARPNFTFDPYLHAGWYYVQEASSMFVHRVISQYVNTPSRMLDLCAAPGGKSTAALSALPDGSTLMSNEPIRQRAQILAENISKWGYSNVIVTNNYPKDYATSGLSFDVILCDVPCSGEGMFRKDNATIGEWSERNVEQCSKLQREIVASAWHCLRPGGILIYSTCTFNSKEDEENVRHFCNEYGAKVIPVETEASWGIKGSLLDGFEAPVYRFIPGSTKGEGLFLAVLKKDESENGTPRRDKAQAFSRRKNKAAVSHGITPSDFLKGNYETRIDGDEIRALPETLCHLYDIASSQLRILSAGVALCRIKGRDAIPSQALALSCDLRREAFPCVELDYRRAVDYLRKEAVTLPQSTPKGIVLVTYRNAVLGFMKNIGNRANNLYPQEWKIKSTHVPDSAPDIIG